MKSIKGTQTEKNLMHSFAGESQARMRYTYFASAAKKEGFEQIAAIFTETADQEKEHAKRMFKFLEGGMVEITASFRLVLLVVLSIICKQQLLVSTKSGRTIILILRMWQSKKVSYQLRLCIVI